MSDEELLATLQSMLHGTARDWWDVVCRETTTWIEFETKFIAAFSDDYEDELTERVGTRVQVVEESFQDFAYMYRSLCRHWKPNIQEDKVIKLILKNSNSKLASQLRSSGVNTVNGLVRLGNQLEKDRDNQLLYEQRLHSSAKPQAGLDNPPSKIHSSSSFKTFWPILLVLQRSACSCHLPVCR